jgi:hypothetical protein
MKAVVRQSCGVQMWPFSPTLPDRLMDLYGRKPESVEGGAPGSVRAPQVKDFADHLFNRSTDVAYRHYE